ncbi:MAG TPA: TolC family protein [Bacteroidales bacterium]|nr:TolC family protein [Bacteroidales bacterium]HPJ05967.1 TolC family protein [Bacteroidales bacterium]HPQ64547.1 TolC family protein [Bacteroidales bacterium]HRW28079.1 TolC family protein [Bacteroidales bacterium]
MKRKILSLGVVLMLSPLALFSQEKAWTLEECIAHALQNNIRIKQQEIMTKYQVNALEQSKLNLLPTLNGSASHNYAFGRALDETTYEFTENETVQSNNFYAGSNVTLFRGLVNYNTIQKNKYQVLASEQELEQFRDDISLNIALAYLQILLNQELVTATEAQVDLTMQQIERTRKLVDAGSVAGGNLLDIEAQAAREELQLVNLRNQLTLSLLSLAQMLELESMDGFNIAVPVISVRDEAVDGNPAAIFSIAEQTRPEILSAEYQLRSAEYDLAIARGNRSPRLNLGASMSTGYSDKRLKPVTFESYPFGEQLNDNLNYSLGFSLNIPIFNGWQVNAGIKNSKLGIENSKYALENTRKQLYKNIQQAYTDATGSLKKFHASEKAVASMEEAFRYAEQKLDVGLVTAIEYNQSKTQLLNAQSEMAQAKYEYVFKTKVLDFYRGIPLTLEHLNILAK